MDDSLSYKSEGDTPDEEFLHDGVLIRAFDNSVNLASDELAKRVADATNRTAASEISKNNEVPDNTCSEQTPFIPKVGDYVRATYDDGVDYEAKILLINEIDGTCLLRYIGYDNEQEVALTDLVASWGKKARQLQFAQAKAEAQSSAEFDEHAEHDHTESTYKKDKKSRFNMRNGFNFGNLPPPPPMPPMMFENASESEENEHLAAMLMSWYMSGYYTGIYQGMRVRQSKSKQN